MLTDWWSSSTRFSTGLTSWIRARSDRETEYTAALGVVWLDPASRLCLINASRAGDAENLASAIASALDVPHLYPVTLTDALLAQVVDEDSIKSSAFVRSEGGTRPRSIRLSDEDLVGKSAPGAPRADGGYRPTYGYYRQRLPGATEASQRFGVGMRAALAAFGSPTL